MKHTFILQIYCRMGLMSDEILGGGNSDDELDLRTTLRLKSKRLNGNTKSYLSNAKGKKIQSDQRRDQIKSSLLSVLDQDDMSYDYSVASEADSGDSFASIRMLHKRSNSLDSPAVGKKDQSQPKLRGKKLTILSDHNPSPAPPPPPPSSKKSPRMGMRKLPLRSNSMGHARPRATAETKNTTSTGNENMEKGLSTSERSSDSAPRRRRQSSMIFASSSRADDKLVEENSGIQNDGPIRVVKRSVSLNQTKRRPIESSAFSDTPRRELVVPGKKTKGKQVGLGSYLSENTTGSSHRPSRLTQDDTDSDDDDNNSVVSSQSWISWAAASALKPLEKLYDDMNGVGDKRPKNLNRSDDSDGDSTDEEEYPNTEAEAYSTKLSTTDKIAGLRFVASKTRRQSLYV